MKLLRRLFSSVVSVLLASGLVTAAYADSPVLRCQRAIEDGGVRHSRRVLREADRCASSGADSMRECLEAPATRARFEKNLPRWRARVAKACAGIDVHSVLGYQEMCAPADTPCGFGAAAVVSPSPRDDLIDCLQCRIEGQLGDVTERLFADVGAAAGCRANIAQPGLDLVGEQLRAVSACLRRPDALSLAGCLSEPAFLADLAAATASWRSAAKNSCGGTNPFLELGHDPLCSGVAPPTPSACSEGSPPCTFGAVGRLDVAGSENDLLDCLACRVDDAALAIARDLFGANLCCDGEGCRAVRTRRSCYGSGGHPERYRQNLIPEVPVGFPNGMAVGMDGTVWLPNRVQQRLWEYTASGVLRSRPSYPDFLDGVTIDPAGVPVLTSRERNVLRRPEGERDWSVVALTGEPGHSGDGGPALAARAAAPMGLGFDSRGTLYLTESGLLAFAFQGAPATGEYIRAIDSVGTIRTVAGVPSAGSAGQGGPALQAQMLIPYGLTVRSDASILIGEGLGQRLLDLDPGGLLAHRAGVPGSIIGSYSGDGGPARRARFNGLQALATDADGNVIIGDFANGRVRLVDRLGSVITILGRDDGAGSALSPEDGVPASLVWGGCPGGVAVGPDGRIYVGDGQHEVLRVLTRVPY